MSRSGLFQQVLPFKSHKTCRCYFPWGRFSVEQAIYVCALARMLFSQAVLLFESIYYGAGMLILDRWKFATQKSFFSPEFSIPSFLFFFSFSFFQLRTAAQAVGEANLENKFAAASESLRRGIMFANSLYL